jgi:hypothetical protein
MFSFGSLHLDGASALGVVVIDVLGRVRQPRDHHPHLTTSSVWQGCDIFGDTYLCKEPNRNSYPFRLS